MTLRSATRVIALLALLPKPAEVQKTESPPLHEQSDFAMEGVAVANPVDLPDSALQALRKNKFIVSCLEANQKPEDIPPSWFVGSEIRLDSTQEIDFVIQPREIQSRDPSGALTSNGCLLHAHSIPFWVLKRTSGGYAVVLEDNAQELRVLKHRSNDCRDIETFISTTLGRTKKLFKWDGHEYKLFEKKTIPA